MRPFTCTACQHIVFYENSVCLQCGSALGYLRSVDELHALVITDLGITRADGAPGWFKQCANLEIAGCNWLLNSNDIEALCESCRLTTMRPGDDEPDALLAFADVEQAKRRMMYQLDRLGLRLVPRSVDPVDGVEFHLLSASIWPVSTGHQGGVITIDLTESDDAHREFVRQQLGEAYRTVLGHLRHEIAHYFWPTLVETSGLLDEFRELFGDETISYEDAKAEHYGDGEEDWQGQFISQYASMHPWEDWAETFAHYLHMRAGLATVANYGLVARDPALRVGPASMPVGTAPDGGPAAAIVASWLSVTFALNGVARSLGQVDLYPFTITAEVLNKLEFVDRAITRSVASNIAAG